jgi:transcription-repair coupling factor (superfamily II helicase)
MNCSRVLTTRVHRRESAEPTRGRLTRFLDLRDGDLVVHVAHGIAKYRGMKKVENSGQQEEHMLLEFRDSVDRLCAGLADSSGPEIHRSPPKQRRNSQSTAEHRG